MVHRLAIIYGALDGAQRLREEHLRAAIALWEYCDRSVGYVFGTSTGDPIADGLLAALPKVGDLMGWEEAKRAVPRSRDRSAGRAERTRSRGSVSERPH